MSLFRLCLLLALPVLSACGNLGDRRAPIPNVLVAGNGASAVKTLAIVLPGRADNVEVMQRYGVAEAIHAGWPDVDVQLTSATLAYYLDGGLATRVREQMIAPARAAGYQRIILLGASMGGMGALLVDQANPGEIDHLVLLAPYLGERKLLGEIADAEITRWQPGPRPATMDSDNFQRELWRHIQTFTVEPGRRARVWLAYGADDRLARTVPVIAPALDAAHILEFEGGHKWSVWNTAATEVMARLRAAAVPAE